jgi:hypothetical protein
VLVEALAAHRENFHVEPPEQLAERLRAAESLQDLERACGEVEAEELTVLQTEVPKEVGIRRDRIDLAWLFRGDVGNLEGLLGLARYSLQLAEDLEAKGGRAIAGERALTRGILVEIVRVISKMQVG